MRPTTIACFVALMLLTAVSCKKESNTIQSSLITSESSTSDDITGINEPGKLPYVKIGSQIWMTKNLNVSHYRNGELIPQVKDPTKWAALTTGAWCLYNNDSATGAVYGKLYNWYAVNDPRGLAPAGWHIPSKDEWDTLASFLGVFVAGGKMKSTGTIEAGTGLWHEPNYKATNCSGFTGLPGGIRYYGGGGFGEIGYTGYWWTSSGDDYGGWLVSLSYNNDDYSSGNFGKNFGFSVRCIRN